MTENIEQVWMVGRGEGCDVKVSDDYVSEYHCVVACTSNGRFLVKDLGSFNGTFIKTGTHDVIRVHGVTWTEIKPGMTLVLSSRSVIPWETLNH